MAVKLLIVNTILCFSILVSLYTEEQVPVYGNQNLFRGKLCSEMSLYYSHIKLAEAAIWENQLRESIFEYEKAFSHKSSPFFYDLINALVVACKLEDRYKINKWLKKLIVDKGIHPNFFKKNPAFKELIADSLWMQMLNNSDYNKKHYNKINLDLVEKYKELYQKDQEVRHKKYKNNNERRVVDSLNLIDFKMLVKKFGFPSEERVGMNYDSTNSAALDPLFSILIRHFSLNGWYNEVSGILDSAIYKGERRCCMKKLGIAMLYLIN